MRTLSRASTRGVAASLRPDLPVTLALGAGLALRLWMLKNLYEVAGGDSLIYGGLAKNLLLHGEYALSLPGGDTYPTLIRLPGYPLFLALCFKIFGMENYFAVACVQIALDLLSCLLLASFVRRIVPGEGRAAVLATLWLAALCPFTASYTVAPLAETPTLFMLALAMWAMARFRDDPRWVNALWFTFAVTAAALLRPDGALAVLAFAPALVMGLRTNGELGLWGFPPFRKERERMGHGQMCADLEAGATSSGLENGATSGGAGETSLRKLGLMAAVCVLLALTPFAVWTARNWAVFHVIEPLAPRLATDPDDRTNLGWEHWVTSWCLDFISTYEIYWKVPGDKLDVSELPNRAFDTPAQYAETAALAEDYNSHGLVLTPGIDASFERLAEERVAAHPMRSHLWLPLGRVTDMWLRPRVENLNIDLDWWVYAHHHAETEFSWTYAGLNAVYLVLGTVGLRMRPRFWGALLAYLLLRSALLWTVDAPETRYTIECFPMLFALGGVAIARVLDRWQIDRLYLSNSKAVLGRG
jgi:Dolichyl-phosphate-mannose-protein mannosyltransferase